MLSQVKSKISKNISCKKVLQLHTNSSKISWKGLKLWNQEKVVKVGCEVGVEDGCSEGDCEDDGKVEWLILSSVGVLIRDGQTDINDCRVAFATENYWGYNKTF